MPKVSIISVYYNRAHCIIDSIQSVLDQTFTDFELILVDDGSSDETLDILNSLLVDKRVRVITHSNMGFVNSIIKAVELCIAPFIAIHGSGDISFPNRISILYDFISSNHEYVLVGSRHERYTEDTFEKIDESSFFGELIFEDFLYKNRFTHGAVMYRKNSYFEVGGYEPFFSTNQDWDLFLRLLSVGKIMVLKDLLYRQYKRKDGAAFDYSKFVKLSKLNSLRILLAKNPKNRESILNSVSSNGINTVISDNDFEFQRVLTLKVLKLAEFGRFNDFLNSSNNVIPSSLLRLQKYKFYFYLIVIKAMLRLKINPGLFFDLFSKSKYYLKKIVKSS